MLLEFRVGNFKSFRSMNTLSMIASNQRDHNDSLIRRSKDPKRVLPVCVLFGPNAGGKTNLITALRFFRNLVETGNVSKALRVDSQLNQMNLRFLYDDNKEPVVLGIVFIQDDKTIEYEVTLDVDDKGEVIIAGEKLVVEGDEIYSRDRKSGWLNKTNYIKNSTVISEHIKDYHVQKDSLSEADPAASLVNNFSVTESTFRIPSNEKELFLTGRFKYSTDGSIARWIESWMSVSLQIYTDRDGPMIAYRSDAEAREASDLMNAFLRSADMGSQQVQLINDITGSGQAYVLFSLYKRGDTTHVVPAETMESRGTLQLFRYLMPFLDALKYGRTVVVDELDISLHPFVLAKIAGIFMDPELNRKGAQLIFTTHSAILMDSSILRRDSLAFVEKDPENFESRLYTLADFKTSGNKPVRNDESYLKNYLEGKYGALPNINLSKAVRQALTQYFEK
ncbi:MAG: ATP-binding protein [Clostridia bacterium]|nr:ATP-binding protein [Clostridia bacterium]